jgi:hypothetical protein
MRLFKLRQIGPLGTALVLGQIAWAVRQHWVTLPLDRRRRLAQLLRQSGGSPTRLSRAERRELADLVRELELAGALRRGATNALVPRL